jgi:hypothetical protein
LLLVALFALVTIFSGAGNLALANPLAGLEECGPVDAPSQALHEARPESIRRWQVLVSLDADGLRAAESERSAEEEKEEEHSPGECFGVVPQSGGFPPISSLAGQVTQVEPVASSARGIVSQGMPRGPPVSAT